jgi:hypothetical protein
MKGDLMMEIRLLLRLLLVAVFLAGCAPASSTAVPAQPMPVEPSATLSAPVPTRITPAQPTAEPSETLEPTPFPLATSRGPELEATDPSTVNLASGGLQLVEFFRFT